MIPTIPVNDPAGKDDGKEPGPARFPARFHREKAVQLVFLNDNSRGIDYYRTTRVKR